MMKSQTISTMENSDARPGIGRGVIRRGGYCSHGLAGRGVPVASLRDRGKGIGSIN